MPNIVAYSVLSSWPVIILFLLKHYGVAKGSLISLLIAYMFLPSNLTINLPGIPGLNKFTITSITLIFYLFVSKRKFGFSSLPNIYKILILIMFVTPFLTAYNNHEIYAYIKGLSLYDGLSSSVINLLYFFPFLIGFYYFSNHESQKYLFKSFAFAAIIYSILALYEIRMSPQLHMDLYGYFPHSWIQQKREGGFRAVLFMGHGLLVAMFLTIGVSCWCVLNKLKYKVYGYKPIYGLYFCFFSLLLMKSLGALLLAVIAFLVLSFMKPIKQIAFSAFISLLFLTYPISSALGIFPHQQIYEVVKDIDEDRAASLKYRFDNENILLEHANQKPLTGWGGWARNRVYDENTGRDISITDGYWIITLGKYGWFGFLSCFMFASLPIIQCFRKRHLIRRESYEVQILIAGHSLILALLLVDQIPNSSLSDNGLYWLFSGALLGRLRYIYMKNITDNQKTEY